MVSDWCIISLSSIFNRQDFVSDSKILLCLIFVMCETSNSRFNTDQVILSGQTEYVILVSGSTCLSKGKLLCVFSEPNQHNINKLYTTRSHGVKCFI